MASMMLDDGNRRPQTKTTNWYSATLRFFIVNSAAGKIRTEDSVFLVRAESFEDAFQQFVRLGRQSETTHDNHVDERIGKRFASVTTLDLIRHDDLSGAEIISTPIFESDPNVTFETPLAPERSKPTQTI